jgi:hypothetical protein
MGYVSTSSLMTVKFTEKIKLFRTSGTFSENEPTMLVRNNNREVSGGRRRNKIK